MNSLIRKAFLSLLAVIFSLSVCRAQNSTDPVTVRDADGNVYTTVRIGKQIWTRENLRTTRFNDGSPIPLVKGSGKWNLPDKPGYCWYNDDIRYKNRYGALYNWFTVNTKKLAPAGWHIPTDTEWNTLKNCLIANGYNWDKTTKGDKIAKSMAATTDWDEDGELDLMLDKVSYGWICYNRSSNNKSGFSAFSGGYLCGWGFIGIFTSADWWSCTKSNEMSAYGRSLYYKSDSLHREQYVISNTGASVRLVKD